MKHPLTLIPLAALMMTLGGVAGAKADIAVGSAYNHGIGVTKVDYYDGYYGRPYWRYHRRWAYGDDYGNYGWRRHWWWRHHRHYGWDRPYYRPYWR